MVHLPYNIYQRNANHIIDNARIKLLKSEAITRLIGLFIDSSWRVRQLAVDAFLTMIPYGGYFPAPWRAMIKINSEV